MQQCPPEAVSMAQEAVDAVAEAEAAGVGAANFRGMMIDAATTRLFEVTLDRARQCGMLDEGAS